MPHLLSLCFSVSVSVRSSVRPFVRISRLNGPLNIEIGSANGTSVYYGHILVLLQSGT